MRALSLRLLTVLGLTTVLWACDPNKEDLEIEDATEYVQLTPGKYITYRLDSTVFTKQGREQELHSYQEKHLIESQITDNQGRPAYRVFRYIRNVAGTNNWSAAGTYMITPLQNSLEVTEDNMRVIKLTSPIKQDYTWKGNRYLSAEPYASMFNFVNDNGMQDWEFHYESTDEVFKYKQQDLTGIVKVVQVDERFALDTVNVVGNNATVPLNSDGVWLRGSATDTIRITASVPTAGNEQLTIYNQTNTYATFYNIVIPPKLALYFEYASKGWYYPNPLTVTNNQVAIPRNASLVYLFGTATANININIANIDTNQTKKITIYNRSNKDAYAPFNTFLNLISIPPGYGRSFELFNGEWRLLDNRNVLLDKDPYISELPFGTTSYGIEKYAKGIGMVYQELLLWEYQPNPGGTSYKIGFGVTRTMIDHN